MSKICRFGGQCPVFYSVAEHSILETKLAIEAGRCDEAVRAVCLHDAAEAYVGDMVKPLKLALPQYSEIEARIARAIQDRFGVDFGAWDYLIKCYDRQMLRIEKVTFWPKDQEIWKDLDTVPLRRDVRFLAYRPGAAYKAFLQLATDIGIR